jgi:copper homeostasis protein
MAFDNVVDWKQAIDDLVSCGVTRILTKGGIIGPATNNLCHLKEINDYAKGKIQIICGGSVTHSNYKKINKETQITIFHGRKLCLFKNS